MADALESRVREIVLEVLAGLGVASFYTSTALPPGIRSREHFAAECRRLKIGEKIGREWRVDASVWRDARAAARKRSPAKAPSSLEARADALLEGAGLRLVKSASQTSDSNHVNEPFKRGSGR